MTSYNQINTNYLPTRYVFVGFSTVNADQTLTTTLYDIDLINRDLNFAFKTRIGERVMRPSFGCAIWKYLENPMTQANINLIQREAIRVCSLDTRIQLQNVNVSTTDNAIEIQLTSLYLPFNVVGSFTVSFNNRQLTYYNE